MKNKGKKILLSALCGLCCLGVATGICIGLQPTSADEATLSSVQIQNSYTLGQSFSAPIAQLSYEGKTYESESYLTYPSGDVRSAASYALQESGVYALTYTAYADNGTLLKQTVTFTVSDALFSVSSERSTAYYGTHETYGTDKEGIVVELANGDTFTYNKVVDLSQNTRNDGIISFFNTPEIEGVQDAKSMVIRFTDLYDQNNYFEVDFHTANNACATAGPLDAPKVGLWRTRSTATDISWTNIVYENEMYQMFQGDTNWGAPLSYNMRQMSDGKALGERVATVGYDYKTKRVYAQPTSIYLGDGMVTDLDDEAFFKNNWKGFTTGEVIVSVYGKSYNAATMGFVITDIGGNDLSRKEIAESTQSIIDVDTLGYDENDLPFGVVGIPYKLFNAQIKTPFTRYVDFKQKVYLNYRSNKTEINVTESSFTPTVAGAYTIEYAATDSFGVKTVKTLDIQVKTATAGKLTVSIATDGATSGNVFEKINVHSATQANVSGNGVLEVVAVAKSGKEYPVDLTDWTFTPEETGTHKVQYTLTDYVSTVTAEYEMQIASVNDPCFLTDASLGAYYVKGATYLTPTLFAHYIEGTETKQMQAKVYVSYNGGAREELGSKFTVKESGEVALTYVATANGATTERTYSLNVVDVGYGKGGLLTVHEYFQADETVTGDKGTYVGASAPADGNVTFHFIHTLGAWNFNMEIVPMGAAYDCVEVLLTDSEDPKFRLAVELSSLGTEQTSVLVNGRYNATIGKDFANTKFTVGYEESSKTVTLNLTQKVRVYLNADDSEFVGFPSKKVFVQFTLKNVTNAYSVQVAKLNGHSFMSKSDGVDPSFYYEGVILNEIFAKGDLITIPRFYVEDVVDVSPTLTVNVKDPDGNFVKSVDGILLDGSQDLGRTYEVEIAQYGVYKCWYGVSDYSGNGGRIRPINYTVEDHVAPTLELSKALVEYKQNDEVTVATATVLDDFSAADKCTVKIYVKSPKDTFFALQENKFTATEKGVYTVFYYAYDEMENLTISKYLITVA